LVASFHATLEEVIEADLVLHVVDSSDPRAADTIAAVNVTLKAIEADRVPTVLVFNKSDRIADDMDLQALLNTDPKAVALSARTGEGLDKLADVVREHFLGSSHLFELDVPIARGRTLARVGELAEVLSRDADETCVKLKLRVADPRLSRLRAWVRSEGLELQPTA